MRSLMILAALAVVPLSAAPARPARAPVRAAVVADWSRTVAATPQGGVRMGNPAAKVQLIEYGSRTCPHCALFDSEGLPALKAGPIKSGKLSYEFRDYPVHGALDLAPIMLGNCIPVSRFFPALDAMFVNQQTLLANVNSLVVPKDATPIQVASLVGTQLGYVALMKQFGLGEAQAKACLANKASINIIAARTRFANTTFKVAGTPTFIVNGKPAENVYDWAALQPVLAAAGI